jgi:hypothetical protein
MESATSEVYEPPPPVYKRKFGEIKKKEFWYLYDPASEV